MLCRWHTFVSIYTPGYQSVSHVFPPALSPTLPPLSIDSIDPLSLQPVRWVSTSRWRVTACAVNVRNTATRRPEPPSPAPATPTSTGRPMTLQQLPAPVSTSTARTSQCFAKSHVFFFMNVANWTTGKDIYLKTKNKNRKHGLSLISIVSLSIFSTFLLHFQLLCFGLRKSKKTSLLHKLAVGVAGWHSIFTNKLSNRCTSSLHKSSNQVNKCIQRMPKSSLLHLELSFDRSCLLKSGLKTSL